MRCGTGGGGGGGGGWGGLMHFQVSQSQSILRNKEGKETEGFRKQLMRLTARELGGPRRAFAALAHTRKIHILASRIM